MTAAPSRSSPPARVRARGLWNLLNLATPLGLVGAVLFLLVFLGLPLAVVFGQAFAGGWRVDREPGTRLFACAPDVVVDVSR